MVPTFEQVDERLSYDPETGAFSRKSFHRKGDRAYFSDRPVLERSSRNGGYRLISVLGRPYLCHRLAYLLMTRQWPVCEIDHINLDRSDHRWVNLRPATKSQNGANRGPASNSKSGLKGVYLCPATGRWRARIKVSKKTVHLGRFPTPEEAQAAYAKAAAMYFGEFARSNT